MEGSVGSTMTTPSNPISTDAAKQMANATEGMSGVFKNLGDKINSEGTKLGGELHGDLMTNVGKVTNLRDQVANAGQKTMGDMGNKYTQISEAQAAKNAKNAEVFRTGGLHGRLWQGVEEGTKMKDDALEMKKEMEEVHLPGMQKASSEEFARKSQEQHANFSKTDAGDLANVNEGTESSGMGATTPMKSQDGTATIGGRRRRRRRKSRRKRTRRKKKRKSRKSRRRKRRKSRKKKRRKSRKKSRRRKRR